jgi:acetoin utilization deacetylase AcuC-like enzyme
VRTLVADSGSYELSPAPLAEARDIELAHDPGYVRDVLQGTLDPGIVRRIGLPWSHQLVQRTRASVGGTLAAARDAVATGFGGNLAGGTHHAFRTEGSGFCVFNDLAVAILTLRRDRAAARAAVIDLDVHQGDGTAAIFEHDEEVLTLSLHAENNFPFRKRQSRIDVALPDGTGDREYLARLRGVLPAVFTFRPQIVFYQAGADVLAGDRLGRLSLSPEGMAARDRCVLEAARDHGVPVVVTLGGGYGELRITAQAHAVTFRTLHQVFTPVATFSLTKTS